MEKYVISSNNLKVTYTPNDCHYCVKLGKTTWKTIDNDPFVILRNETRYYFSKSTCESKEYVTGTVRGVKAVYSWPEETKIQVTTFLFIDQTDEKLHAEFFVTGDLENEIRNVWWPSPIEFNTDNGYTVLPKMQGVLLPAKWDGVVPSYESWHLLSRDYYMAFVGQVKDNAGYMFIVDTPYDADIFVDHKPKGDTILAPFWRTSLGHILPQDKRKLIYTFFEEANYVTIAKEYRKYIIENGEFMTLKEKIAENPNVEYMLGTPINHDLACRMIKPGTAMYKEGDDEHNNVFIPFDVLAERLKNLKKSGIEKVYMHLDGWGKTGYDRQHPDIFPPCEKCGGPEGMKRLSETARELGYRFGIHDQYRDYYFDADTFDLNNVTVDCDGKYQSFNVWYGGEQTFLCPELSPQYVRRNYANFDALGIQIDGSYLDVFSIVEVDECFNKEHMVTRRDCVKYRKECYDILTAKGIITSSEEPVDKYISALALVHHGPLAVDQLGSDNGLAVGIPIPLFNLVYHECLIVPWFGPGFGGGFHIPRTDSGYLYALLTAGTVYVYDGMSEEDFEKVNFATNLQKKLAFCEMTKHEFLGNYRRQKATYSDGTEITVDFDDNTFIVKEGKN